MNCPTIPEKDYSELWDAFFRVHGRTARYPISGAIEITARCNLNCVHCYINLPPTSQNARLNELTTHEIRAIMDQLASEGCLWLLITGGEPLLRSDFLEIYDAAKQKGFLVSLFTNGTLVTPQIAEHLAEYPPYEIEVTLYGFTEETYEQVTRVPGSYDRCVRGINLLMEHNAPLKLKSTISTLNRHELTLMKSYARDLGLDFRFDACLNGRIDCRSVPDVFRLSPADVVALDMADEERLLEWRKITSESLKPLPDPGTLYQCGAGYRSFNIDPYGSLGPCALLREEGYDLRNGSFHTGWHDFLGQFMIKQRRRTNHCETCDLMSLCGLCPGKSWTETGDPEDKIDYFCDIGRTRAISLRLRNARSEEGEEACRTYQTEKIRGKSPM